MADPNALPDPIAAPQQTSSAQLPDPIPAPPTAGSEPPPSENVQATANELPAPTPAENAPYTANDHGALSLLKKAAEIEAAPLGLTGALAAGNATKEVVS